MTFSEVFIRRPIGTTLLAIGLTLVGLVAWSALPVANLPVVDLPTLRISASRPGADPETMAATVAAPLERRLGEIAGVTELTSSSTLGSSNISIQFDLGRNIVGAARDVQAALNAAATDLPSDLPTLPVARKFNSAAAPILIFALTSDTLSAADIYDVADTVIAQRMAQVEGVADVSVSGADQPAIRVRVDPAQLAAMNVSLDQIRTTIANANALGPVGAMDGVRQGAALSANDQMTTPSDFGALVVKSANGALVQLSSIAQITPSVRNTRSLATFNGKPAVLLVLTKQADANVIDTVDRVFALLPELRRWIPASLAISVLTDRTNTIRTSVKEMEMTLGITVCLVMLVVFVFLRNGPATAAAGVTVPLSLAGTFAAMWAAGFSVDNISLMALVVSVGFVVDDAIVIIENIHARRQAGLGSYAAAIEGARQIGFTVFSISLSLAAAFIPLLLMGGIIGRFLREFAWTLVFAIAFSTLISLSLTPMLCAHLVHSGKENKRGRFGQAMERFEAALLAAYASSLKTALQYWGLTLLALMSTLAMSAGLFLNISKSVLPQDDTGLIMAYTEAAPDISFDRMAVLQKKADEIIRLDPAVVSVGSTIGGSAFGGPANQGRMFISVKPLPERGGLALDAVLERMRKPLSELPGIRVYLNASQDVRVGARSGKSAFQFTLWDADFGELKANVARVVAAFKSVPGLIDVSTDRESNGLQANVVIDRMAASRLGVKIQDIDTALSNAFSQRQISTIYTARNQYRVVLEVTQPYRRDPSDLTSIYVPGAAGQQVPLSSVARIERGLAPLQVNHQGQFPAITITYGLEAVVVQEDAVAAVMKAIGGLHLPDTLHAEFAGDAKAFINAGSSQGLLILAALLSVYLVLGILYESLAHPLTILSTLPPAGLGALLALRLSGTDLSLIALIGIILLIGLVKKNGIMLVDFALVAEREHAMAPREAIIAACMERFRPILMTTFAALLGALPLIIASGPGSELRRPLGITIAGGLLVSQLLTLYTTPVVYLLLDRLHHFRGWRRGKTLDADSDGAVAASPPAL